MSLDNKTIFPDSKDFEINENNYRLDYTTESKLIINEIQGNTEYIDGEYVSVGYEDRAVYTNLFDISTISEGYLTAAGRFVANTKDYTSDFIEIEPSTNYFSNTNINVFFYDNSKTFISRASTLTVTNFTTPENAVYFRFYNSKDIITNKIIIVKGDYIPFDYKMKIKTKGYETEKKYEDEIIVSIPHPLRSFTKEDGTIIRDIIFSNYGLWYCRTNIGINEDGSMYELDTIDVYENNLYDMNNSLNSYGRYTIVYSEDIVMPVIKLTAPIDYAYDEYISKYTNEEIIIEQQDIDDRKNIKEFEIEGQTFENLLKTPLENGKAIIPIDIEGKECLYTDKRKDIVPLKEIQGDTYINLLEDKIESVNIKSIASYSGELVDGKNIIKKYTKDDFTVNNLSNIDGNALADANWGYTEDYISIPFGCTKIMFDNIDISRNVRICFYDENNVYIKNSAQTKNELICSFTNIPSTAKVFRFACSINNLVGSGKINLIMDTSSYNLNNKDNVVIDEIKGNSKLYHETIPIADLSGNLYCGADLNSSNNFTSDFFYVGHVTTLSAFGRPIVAIYLFDSSTNSLLNNGWSAAYNKYDKNLKYTSFRWMPTVDNTRNGTTGDFDKTEIYGKISLNTSTIDTSLSYKLLILQAASADSSVTEYTEPNIIGAKAFPIQSVGELYVDDQGQPILDNDNKEQYKINIISESHKNLINFDDVEIVAGQNTSLEKIGFNSYRVYGNSNYMGGLTIKNVPIKWGNFKFVFEFDYEVIKGMTNSEHGLYPGTNISKPDGYEWHIDMSNKKGKAKISFYTTTNGVRDMSYWLTRATAEDCEVIFSNIKIYEVNNYEEEYSGEIKTLLLPQPLLNYSDRYPDILSWEKNLGKYVITQKNNIAKINTTAWMALMNGYDDKDYIGFATPSISSYKFYCNDSNIQIKEYNTNITGQSHFKILRCVLESEDLNGIKKYLNNNNVKFYCYVGQSSWQTIETNITEQLTLSCCDNATYIYSNGTSSHDNTNLPPVEKIKGEITCTTLPLSTTAYIKPNTKYTIFMDTNCEVKYNLGGSEGNYINSNEKVLLTTPSTLADVSLTLSGEGNIGNITLLEGDYTGSYVPKKFINDIFSVGDLQEDGTYKVDIVSKNKTNLFSEELFRKVPPKQIVDGIEYYHSGANNNFGSTSDNSGFYISMNFKENTQYTFQWSLYNPSNARLTLKAVYTDGELSNVNMISASNFTSNENKTLEYVYIVGDVPTNDNIVGVGKIQIEEGITATEYEKPQKYITTVSLPCQLLKVGNAYDRLYWDIVKGKYCIEKNVTCVNLLDLCKIRTTLIGRNTDIGLNWFWIGNTNKANAYIVSDKLPAYSSEMHLNSINTECISNRNNASGFNLVISDKTIGYVTGNRVDFLRTYLENNTIRLICQSTSPEIIETDITEYMNIDVFEIDTVVNTTSTVNPYIHLKSDVLSRIVDIKPSTKYYIFGNTTSEVEVNLGGSKIQYTPSDIVKEITTPRKIDKPTIEFIGISDISNVMVRTDNRTDIKYFNGIIYASILQDDETYKTIIEAKSSASDIYDNIFNIITNSPLKAGDKFVIEDNIIKLLKKDGNYEDLISSDLSFPILADQYKAFKCYGEAPAITTAIINYRYIRTIKTAKNINMTTDLDTYTYTLLWDYDLGVESNDIYYNNELLVSVPYPESSYSFNTEKEGQIYIISKNELTQSDRSSIYDILTYPDPVEITNFKSIYDEGYVFNIYFSDNLGIRKGFKFYYQIDEQEEVVGNLTNLNNNSEKIQNIETVNINTGLKVKINPYNNAGERETEYKTFYVTPTPNWAYQLNSNKVLFRINDNFDFLANYKLQYKKYKSPYTWIDIDEWTIDNIGSNNGTAGTNIDYLLSLAQDEEMYTLATMNDGKFDHIPSSPIRVSKTLDLSLLAPSDFTFNWSSDGKAKFSWTDSYTNDKYFEFKYSLDGGTEQTVRIDSTTTEEVGSTYYYEYDFGGVEGTLIARVRMISDLNQSEYTDYKVATFVTVTGLPPAWIMKKYDDSTKLRISWEPQTFVSFYELQIEIDGKIQKVEVTEDRYILDVSNYRGKNIKVNIITHFTTDVVSEPTSNGLNFKPTLYKSNLNNITFTKTEFSTNPYQLICTFALNYKYNDFCFISHEFEKMYQFFEKFINKDVMKYNILNTNIWSKGYEVTNYLRTDIFQKGLSFGYILKEIYSNIQELRHQLKMQVYYSQTSEYKIHMEINKTRIVCFGDSITAGHPGFWAESMTGNVEHQYEYWLDRRLKYNYEILNKGYGSDRTYNLVDRIDKDVIAYSPQYCIIQIGTNDIYWGAADANGDKTIFETTLDTMKANVQLLVNKCFQNNIKPILGNLIPRTQSVTDELVRYGLYSFNDWIALYANTTEGLNYIDFFNAGKSNVPPTPLEDPNNPGALNPLYDGDNVYDEEGNLVRYGAGIHPNAAGYRIMAEAIPLNLFQDVNSGLKMYIDEACTTEAIYNDQDKQNPYYSIELDGLTLGRTKRIVRYLKNVGNNQCIFAFYQSSAYNVKFTFSTPNLISENEAYGLLVAGGKVAVYMDITPQYEDSKSSIDLHLASREFTLN